jgi:N-acetylglucosamine-6-phosphate deacetylase
MTGVKSSNGLPGRAPSAGQLAPGMPANFVAVNPDGTLAASFLNGQPAS